jgi:hypothetical protein
MNAILVTGAALVGLPILLHLLLRQEPKRLRFPAYHFLTQQLRTNQRKLRLRHLLLLLLRMGLIALFCLALYQPVLYSERLHFLSEQPVAAVLIIDTTPSMEYVSEERSRLQEARRRALELLEELPPRSAVAVVTTDDLSSRWTDVSEAKSIVERIDHSSPASGSLSAALATAYQLLAKIDAPEGDDATAWNRLVVLFTDRTVGAWEAERTPELVKLRDSLPGMSPIHTVFDVGVDQPINFAITAALMKPQVIAANQPAVVTLTVTATGPTTAEAPELIISAVLDQNWQTQKKLQVPFGQARAVRFEFPPPLTPGFHAVVFRIENSDRLAVDNSRYLVFQVGASRSILTIAGQPDDALFWQAAHAAKGEFQCLVVAPEQIRRTPEGRVLVEYPDPNRPATSTQEELSRFDIVAMLNVQRPQDILGGASLWDKLRSYLQSGGKLIIIPGPELDKEGYHSASDLLPARFGPVIDTRQLEPPPPSQTAPGWPEPRDGRYGVTWLLDDRTLQHPLLRDFQLWRQKGNVTDVVNPRRAWKYYEIVPDPQATLIVRYRDHTDPSRCRPALVERIITDPADASRIKGRVILLTTRLDVHNSEYPPWNDYWEQEGSSWYVVFPYLLARYLAGDLADANFNYTCGDSVMLTWPRNPLARGTRAILEGPGVTGSDQILELGEQQREIRLGPPVVVQPGNYTIQIEAFRWQSAFSLNIAAQESILERLPVEALESFTGPNSVVPLEKNRPLRDMIERSFGGPIELFPWLLLLLLTTYAIEGILANRFYGFSGQR